MRTIPRSIDRKGEHLSRCDVCGCMWLRSSLMRGQDGLLRCPQDKDGRDEVTLAALTASRAADLSRRFGASTAADGAYPHTNADGTPVTDGGYTGPVSRRTAEDVYQDGVPTGF